MLFSDMKVKEGVKDNHREAEKIKHGQVGKNFASWLLAYTIYLGLLMQVQAERALL